MSVEDIDGLSYFDGVDPNALLPTAVPRGLTQRLKILVAMYLKWSFIRGRDIDISTVTLADFYAFRTEEYNPLDPFGTTHRAVAAITAPHAPPAHHAHVAHAGAPTPAQQFDRGIKKDKDHYPEFKDEKYWDNFRHGVETTADIHGTSNVLNGAFTPDPADLQAVELFAAQKRFMYAVFESKLKTDMGMSIVRLHEVDRDAQAVWREISNHQMTSTTGSIAREALLS
jgi:hypothetical protein